MKQKRIFLCVLAFMALIFTSCSEKIIGYSIVLWDIPEQKILSGDVLPVYIKSNISHVYIAGNKSGEKIEVPLWKMTEPIKKRKLEPIIAKYSECARTYAHVKIDGLPCREEPVNTSKQVYRFRKNEIIKILYKGVGQPPMSGDKALEGDWYRVITNDGTEGWCFSYSLNLFEMDENSKPIITGNIVIEEDVDEVYENVVNTVWYPENFRAMIDKKNFDLTLFNSAYKFYIDLEKERVVLNTSTVHEAWPYKGYKKVANNEYRLEEIPIKIIVRRDGFIVVKYTDSSGKPIDIPFIKLNEDENVDNFVQEEKERRADEYRRIVSKGPDFTSSTYGMLTLTKDGTFKWTGFDLLVPSVIPSKEKDVGTVSVKYSISRSIAKNYDGVLTFKFQGNRNEVNFFYKVEDGGLRLEDTSNAILDGNQYRERGSSPVIMYFKSR